MYPWDALRTRQQPLFHESYWPRLGRRTRRGDFTMQLRTRVEASGTRPLVVALGKERVLVSASRKKPGMCQALRHDHV